MKKIFKILIILFLITEASICFNACKKDSLEAEKQNEIDDKGKAVLWVNTDYGNVTVYVDGEKAGTITGYLATGEPECGESNCLTLTLEGGTHQYVATCHSGVFSRSFTVVSGTCNAIKIY